MNNIEIETKWRTELKGSPIVQLSNGKWQTWIQIKDKLTDRGRKRFTASTRENLLSGLSRAITNVQTGRIILDAKNLDYTATMVANSSKNDMARKIDSSASNEMRKLSESINRLENMIIIFQSNQILKDTPLVQWGLYELRLFLENISIVSKNPKASINKKYFRALKELFSFAKVELGISITGNIVQDFINEPCVVKSGKFTASGKERKYNLKKLMKRWDIEMMKRFFNEHITYKKNPIWHMILYICTNTGMRCGELFALEIKDFNYSSNGQSTLTVSGFVDRQGYRTTYGKTENAELRIVPIGRGLAEKLKMYIPTIESSPLINNPNGILFPQLSGYKNNTGSIWKGCEASYYKACTTKLKLAEIMCGEFELPKGLRFHWFRSWLATQWYANDIYNNYEISAYLGHSKIRTTEESYIHIVKGIHKKLNKEDFKENLLF